MTALRKPAMTADDFVAWAARQSGKFELFDGFPRAMSPERVLHGDTKYRVARALDAAIAAAGAPCRFVLDSAAVRVDARNLYQPDALLYCGEPVPGDSLEIANPVVLVEILSPSTALIDLRDKLQAYFRIPSVRHYLIVDPDKRLVIHHARGEGELVQTRIVNEGTLQLEPPGIELVVGDLLVPS
jgi:Uma2 family endonuclease